MGMYGLIPRHWMISARHGMAWIDGGDYKALLLFCSIPHRPVTWVVDGLRKCEGMLLISCLEEDKNHNKKGGRHEAEKTDQEKAY